MPDALSKTVPIWIAVLNRLLFPDDVQDIETPSDVVSGSEHAQIERLIPRFAEDARSLGLDVPKLRQALQNKPMRAVWSTPDFQSDMEIRGKPDMNLVVLCTASGRRISNTPHPFEYVQGAADDSESWAYGMTPPLFWSNVDVLLSSSEDDLPGLIRTLVDECPDCFKSRVPCRISPTRNIWIGDNTTAQACLEEFDVVVSCTKEEDEMLRGKLKDRYVRLACSTGKVGSRELRVALPAITNLATQLRPDVRVLVTCPTGSDLAIGAALALICLFCEDNGSLRLTNNSPSLSKTTIKHRLSWIMVSMPDAAPSRATLQSVNAFLLG